jgi:AcrR family transcriptional regulator
VRHRDLSRPQILQAALDLIDARGLEGCTMQAVAGSLGVTAKALYRHVADKDALLRGVADLALSGAVLPDPSARWTDQLKQIGLELKRVLDAHPNVTPLCARRASVFPGVIPIADSAIRAVSCASLPPETGIRFGHAITNYTLGFCLDAADHALNVAEEGLEDPFEDVELHLVPHAAQQAAFLREFANYGGYASPEQYLFGLDLMVAGFEAWARDHTA